MTSRRFMAACLTILVLAASTRAALLLKHGSTSNIIRVVLKNSLTGQGLTGLTNSSSGLVISTIANNEATATTYTVAASNIETITTLGTYAAPTAGKCRFKEVDATNHPGLYEIQLADARFAVSGAKVIVISVSGATNLLSTDYEIQFIGYDPTLANLPANVTQVAGQSATVASTPIDGNVTKWAGTTIPGVDTAGYPKVTIKDGTGAGEIDTSAGFAQADVRKLNNDATAAANAESFFDGAGYGPMLLRTTISRVTSQTAFVLNNSGAGSNPGAETDNAYNGCTIVFYSPTLGEDGGIARSVRTITGYNYDSPVRTVTIDNAPNFTIASGVTVDILPPP